MADITFPGANDALVSSKTWTYTQSAEANLFKIVYGKLNRDAFNDTAKLYSRIMKKEGVFKGREKLTTIRLSFGGGRGSGQLPRASRALYRQMRQTTKKLYHRLEVDRETFEASKSSLGAFASMAKEPMETARIAFANLLERQMVLGDLTGSGNIFAHAIGAVGTASANIRQTTNTAIPTTAASFTLRLPLNAVTECLEEGDVVDVATRAAPTAILTSATVTGITEQSGTTGAAVSLAIIGTPTAAIPAANATSNGGNLVVYMQRSRGNELEGLRGVLTATSGTYKGIEIGRRWQSYQQSSVGKLTVDVLNAALLAIEKRSGQTPTAIHCSTDVYRRLLNLLEDKKQVYVPMKSDKKAELGFKGVVYIGPSGEIPVMHNRYIKEGELYLLNEKKIELSTRAAPQWFNDDGTVFLRTTDEDSMEARYGCYGDFVVHPLFQGILQGITS